MKSPTIVRIAAALLLGAVCFGAQAAQRTFVASFGNDANPCTIASPCRTFGAAMALTDANGEVIVLDSAGYGPVTINQSVSIIAPDGVYAGVSVFAAQNGITVSGGAKVVLRGLTVNGQGGNEGIWVLGGTQIHVERCVISNMGDAGIRIEGGATINVSDSVIRSNAGRGVDILAGAAEVILSDTQVLNNGSHGIFAAAGALTLNRVLSAENGLVGLEVRPPAAATVHATVRDSIFSGNGDAGLFLAPQLAGSQARVIVERSSALRNTNAGFSVNTVGLGSGQLYVTGAVVTTPGFTGIVSSGAGATVILTGTTVTRNSTGLLQELSAVLNTCQDNKIFGNGTATSGSLTPLVGCTQ